MSTEGPTAARLGMWIFLATEALFFGVLFCVYIILYYEDPRPFLRMSGKMQVFLGTLNTLVLLFSSWLMVKALEAVRKGKNAATSRFLAAANLLGVMFLLLKAYEYHHHWKNGLTPYSGEIFLWWYYAATGVHAFHLIIGLGINGVVAWFTLKGRYTPQDHLPVELGALYWHFVDLIWVYLFPLIYLMGGEGL